MLVRILAATVAGGLVFFCVGYVLFGIVLDPIMKPYVNEFPGTDEGAIKGKRDSGAWMRPRRVGAQKGAGVRPLGRLRGARPREHRHQRTGSPWGTTRSTPTRAMSVPMVVSVENGTPSGDGLHHHECEGVHVGAAVE